MVKTTNNSKETLEVGGHGRIYKVAGICTAADYRDGRFMIDATAYGSSPAQTFTPREALILACRALGCRSSQLSDVTGLTTSAVRKATDYNRMRIGSAAPALPTLHFAELHHVPVISRAFKYGVLKPDTMTSFDSGQLNANDRYTWHTLAVKTGDATFDQPLNSEELYTLRNQSLIALIGRLGVANAPEAVTLYHMSEH